MFIKLITISFIVYKFNTFVVLLIVVGFLFYATILFAILLFTKATKSHYKVTCYANYLFAVWAEHNNYLIFLIILIFVLIKLDILISKLSYI